MFKAKFSFYWDWEEEGLEPKASYFVIKSDIPALPANFNVGAKQITDAGQELPYTPMIETWRYMIKNYHHCGKCFSRVEGKEDLENHYQSIHFMKYEDSANEKETIG